jgi:signal transduction histidine kinase
MKMSTNRYIDYSKVSSGLSLVPSLEVFEVYVTIRSSIEACRIMDAKDSSRIHFTSLLNKAAHCYIESDRQWFQENILCLVSNSVSFGDNERIDVTMEVVSVNPEGGPRQIRISVDDQSPPIRPADREEVFASPNEPKRVSSPLLISKHGL